MDDDIIELVQTADAESLAKLIALIYEIGQFEAHGWEHEPIEHPILAAFVETARRRHWDSLEVRRAEASKESEIPDWLRAAQGPPPLPDPPKEERARRGPGC